VSRAAGTESLPSGKGQDRVLRPGRSTRQAASFLMSPIDDAVASRDDLRNAARGSCALTPSKRRSISYFGRKMEGIRGPGARWALKEEAAA
jgi:hypothetical protein